MQNQSTRSPRSARTSSAPQGRSTGPSGSANRQPNPHAAPQSFRGDSQPRPAPARSPRPSQDADRPRAEEHTFSSRQSPRNGQGGGRPMRTPRKVVKQNIPHQRFVRIAKPVQLEEYVAQNRFADFNLDQRLMYNIKAKGYEFPTAIQDHTITHSLTGKDLVGLANTGTGKTAAFAIPVVQRLLQDPESRALIMAPTRELAVQIEEEFKGLCAGTRIQTALIIGGTNIRPQIRKLAARPRVIIGTPGRLKDHVEQKTLVLGSMKIVVLDEVDRMLDMGFLRDIQALMGRIPTDRQSLFFSATMEANISSLIEKFSRDPVRINVVQGETSDNVNQNVVFYRAKEEKIERLHDILNQAEAERILVFEDTKHQVDHLCKSLVQRGFKSDSIHGNKSQAQRQRALDKFRSGEISILVATDVAARGIDVPDISHVVNFSAPVTWDDYIHRIGRAGRAGKSGQALTFLPHPECSHLER